MPLNNSGPNFILHFECPNYNFYHKLNLMWSACRLALSWVYDKSTNHLTRIDIPAFKINLKFKINLFPIYLIFLYYYFQNLSSWKDRRRKQSEEALMRVAEVKALESEGDDYNQQKKRLAKPVFLKKRYILQLSLKFHYSFTFWPNFSAIV